MLAFALLISTVLSSVLGQISPLDRERLLGHPGFGPGVGRFHPNNNLHPSAGAVILQKSSENHIGDGNFRWAFETSDGTRAEQAGFLKGIDPVSGEGIQAMQGSYSYVSPEGITITVNYIADENGFQPIGDHIPGNNLRASGILPNQVGRPLVDPVLGRIRPAAPTAEPSEAAAAAAAGVIRPEVAAAAAAAGVSPAALAAQQQAAFLGNRNIPFGSRYQRLPLGQQGAYLGQNGAYLGQNGAYLGQQGAYFGGNRFNPYNNGFNPAYAGARPLAGFPQ